MKNKKNNKPSIMKGPLEVRHVSWWFIVPAAALILLLRIVPSIIGVAYSLTDWNGLKFDANFIWFDNFKDIFTDKSTSGSVVNTIIICFAVVIFANILGLALAMLLQVKFKLRNVYRAIFFIPYALSHLATGYVWQFILSYDGPVNSFLSLFGIKKNAWLADPNWAIVMIIIVLVWQYTGLCMVIYLAGLEGISEEIHEACALDRAKKWFKFRKVTLPLLVPALVESLTLTVIWSLATFDQIMALTGGGPAKATETLAFSTYMTTYRYGLFGKGAALATILMILIAIFTFLQKVLTKKAEGNAA